VALLAVAAGAVVANLYYAQPLMDAISQTFRASTVTTGLSMTAMQAGYAAGLVLLVPLGDILERRRLVTTLAVASILGLAGQALSPTLMLFAFAGIFVGLTSVVAQTVVPLAADLADEAERGRVVGTVMSGLLIGVLLSRTFSGAIAEVAGWRTVYWVAAALMLALSVLLRSQLPRSEPANRMPYLDLLRSVLTIVQQEPVLRRRALYGALQFGAFNILWTSLAFLLARPPYGYSEGTIGLFGLVGIAGALAASFAGRLADKGWQLVSTGVFLATSLASFALIGIGSALLAPLVAGIVLLDLGVQGTHITNQSQIYKLRPDARSRLTTVYMTSFFIGGASGSAASSAAFALLGWTGVCAVGGAFTGGAVAIWLFEFAVARTRDQERRATALSENPEWRDSA
jgi:predicted MFS family arabinose efflux permease